MKLHEQLRKATELLDRADVQIREAFTDAHGYTFDKILHLIEAVSVAKFLADEAANDVRDDDEEAAK